jgi:hypothetical protein
MSDARPGKSSISMRRIVPKVFDDASKKTFAIPTFIDDYNHNMNDVDLANQYRALYETHMSVRCNWLPFYIDY